MAAYHCSVKTISRARGRSATAAAAYRAGVVIQDLRTGVIHDFSLKSGVVSAVLVLPTCAPQWATDRATVWNAAEQAETRKNSTVAREFELALPFELAADQRERLAHDFARELVERHGCAADVAIHQPSRTGDERNHHAHVLLTTRRLGPEGFTEKTRELDNKKSGVVKEWRTRWAQLQNERFAELGLLVRVDHRSYKERGIDKTPTKHLGPAASGFERRKGQKSRRRLDHEEEAAIAERLTKAKQEGEQERSHPKQIVIDTTADVRTAIQQKEQCEREEGIARARAAFNVSRLEQEKQRLRDQAKAALLTEEAQKEDAEWRAQQIRDQYKPK